MSNPAETPSQGLEHTLGRQFRWYNIVMIFAMSMGSILIGYANSVIGTALAQPSFILSMGLDHKSNAKELIGMTNSLFQTGGVIGCLLTPTICDHWGRRLGIAAPTLLAIIASACLAGSTNIEMFIAFRFICGVAVFSINSAIPVWMTEVAPPSKRGTFVDIHNFSIMIGYAAATWTGIGFYHVNTSNNTQWRAQFAFNCLPGLLLLIFLIWIPESPRWLTIRGHVDEAQKVLQRLHTPAEASVELIQIQQQMEVERELRNSYWAIVTTPSYRKRALMAAGTTLSVQMAAPLVMNNYGPTLYATLGFDTNQQLLYAGGWILTAMGGALGLFLYADKVPRPVLLSGGLLICEVCFSIEAALIAKYATTAESLANPNASALKAAVAVIYVYILLFELSLGGTQFVYCSEIFPTHLRTKGMAISIAAQSAINILWLQVAPVAFSTIGWKFFLCFICPGTLASILIYLVFPDTLGVPLEAINELFGDTTVAASSCDSLRAEDGAPTDQERHSKDTGYTHVEVH
ncbi:hypothetical protein LTR84_005710 [Exophiala bonariae]|uniref:Major facilitator superfamily (MFS) profile domain-containing protein n=1 Tax=Exophiala bonariae TaxID=1690606 RepID=A0AAV9N360_9EURO|nr:hypothetical protein LTR84_005710 [Exophiala bonariae]